MMAKCDALISGSFALQFFARTVWKESDLDIYIQSSPKDNVKIFGEYLIAHEDYALDDTKHIEDDLGMDCDIINQVDTYVKKEAKGHKSCIHIISTYGTAIEGILSSYITTALVNVISWQSAYAAFPDTTFKDMKTYQLVGFHECLNPLLENLARRGWTTLEVISAEDERRVRSLWNPWPRRLGDSLAWKVPLEIEGVTPGISGSVIEFSTFKVYKNNGRWLPPTEKDFESYLISFNKFESCALQYEYFFTGPVDDDFWYSIRSKLEDLTVQQLSKLEDHPLSLKTWEHGRLFKYAGDIHENTPEGWTYYDDEIPKWLNEWKLEKARKIAVFFKPEKSNNRGPS
ncbi:uncharacterized protein LY89DRAFT_684041 [Mollisia scopiformis]|uniref:Uncharacterized protein n=1 Tax=Mollisia scopiformis TaxID=149040 RepID=A0A194XD89_MOLSC|nr:uncharacterized protein LY89DRAFT_684041 [Mollisia scopiformis]KUJ18116.1 hypothetical protein LY89DRAFT_684041 [Mollisia scopiformis]